MPQCNGPDNTAGDGHTCYSTSQMTSCASDYSTCFYAYVENRDKAEWFSGQFLSGQGLKIHEPAALADIGISAGNFINEINGAVLTDEAALLAALAPFTETAPAVVYSVAHLAGKFQLSLSH